MFGSSEDIIRTTMVLCYDLDLEHSDPIFHGILWLTVMFHQIMFSCKWIRSLEDILEIVIF